jgi:hypothetical protein
MSQALLALKSCYISFGLRRSRVPLRIHIDSPLGLLNLRKDLTIPYIKATRSRGYDIDAMLQSRRIRA